MADNLITLQMIAREFIRMTGAKEATACFVYDIKKDLRSLVIRCDGKTVVDYGTDEKMLELPIADFSRMVLAPLADLFTSGIIHDSHGFCSFDVQESATVSAGNG